MEMKVETSWTEKRHFLSKGPSGFELSMDAAEAAGGTNQGHRPMELLLMGLTGCTGIDIAMIMERMRQPMETLEIDAVGARREEYPQGFTEIHLYYKMTGQVQPAKAWRAIHLSENKYCSASASLAAKIIPHLFLNDEEILDSTEPTDLPD